MQKTMKKTLSIILAILMIVTTVPMAFAAEDFTYDEATETYTVYTFAGLETALTAGGNIILGADIIRENTKDITAVPENITAVLDLNGKTITSAPAVPGVNYEIICVNGNLTIKDSDTNGTITANSVISCIYVEGGNLTIEAGNFICDPDLSFAVDVYSGNAVINGGTFTNFNVFDEGKAVINGGTFTDFNVSDEGKAVINGGEFQSCIWTSGSLIINGGTFYGENYVYGGTFDIYGGEFHEDPSEYVANGYEAVANENGTWTVVCAHTDKLVQVDAKAPTCTEIGWDAYEYCTACDYTTYVEIPENGHTALDAVIENEVASKCGLAGSYDLVVYCACGEELDRDKFTVEALKHSFTKYEVTEEAKCGVAGKEVAYCDHGCGATDEKEIEALRHSFTKYEVTEEAKCGVEGKEVAYCDNGCGATDEKAIDALTHTDADGDYICDHGCGYEYEKPAPEEPTPDTPDEPTDSTCDHLCHKSGILGFFWKIVKFFSKLFKLNPVCECGAAHY